MRRLFGMAFLASLFIHVLLATSLALFARLFPPAPPAPTVVEIDIVKPAQPLDKKSKQIVREALLPDKVKTEDSEDPLRFWSHQTQRVQKQTRAANIGMTQNRAETPGERPPNQARPEQTAPEPRNSLDRDELLNAARPSSSRGRGLPSLGDPGMSTIGESLPEDVQIGSFTALNTDRYLYYSFYSRVEGLIRFRWETAVQRALDMTPPERLAANVRNRWITHMEILLNSKGEFLKVILLKESGISAFDQAAALAFAQARYFPNPPQEMVDADGMIHLKYSFTVNYDPRVMARP